MNPMSDWSHNISGVISEDIPDYSSGWTRIFTDCLGSRAQHFSLHVTCQFEMHHDAILSSFHQSKCQETLLGLIFERYLFAHHGYLCQRRWIHFIGERSMSAAPEQSYPITSDADEAQTWWISEERQLMEVLSSHMSGEALWSHRRNEYWAIFH